MQLADEHIRRHDGYMELAFPHPDSPKMYLSLREAGSMSWKHPEGAANRRRLYSRIGIEEAVHAQIQEHTRSVHRPDAHTSTVPPVRVGDGLIQTEEGEWLSATAADCMPIWIWNPLSMRTALLHSGWKGTGILAEALKMLQTIDEQNYRSEEIRILLGPSIGSCCYQVDRERYELFRSLWGERAVVEGHNGFYLSLLDANRGLAEQAGIVYCYTYAPCTYCNREFGSFRREGAENFTSMLALSGYFQ